MGFCLELQTGLSFPPLIPACIAGKFPDSPRQYWETVLAT